MALKITHYLIILWIRNLGEVQQCPLAQDLSQGCDQGVHWGCRRLKAQLEKDPLLSTLSGPWQDSVPSKLLDSGPWFLSGFWPGAALSSLASLQGNIQHHYFSHQNTVYIFLRYQKSLKVQKSLVKYHNYKTLGYFLSLYYEDISYYQGFPCSSGGKEFTCNTGDLIPGLERFPGEGNGNPLQYSCLETSMDREAWQLHSMVSQKVGHN